MEVAQAQPEDTSPAEDQAAMVNAPEITPEVLEEAFRELEASDLPRKTDEATGHTIFTLKEGIEMGLPNPDAPQTQDSNMMQPFVSGGTTDQGVWLSFTPSEQDLIISGGGFALGLALCAIPGAGWAVCTIIEAIILGAGWMLGRNKPCGDNWVRIDYTLSGTPTGVTCV